MKKTQRNPEIVWRIEKRRQSKVLNALESGEEADDIGTVTLIQGGMLHQLNLVGGMVWERCDGNHTLAQIVDELMKEFEVEREDLEADVEAFVEDLVGKGWLIDG